MMTFIAMAMQQKAQKSHLISRQVAEENKTTAG